MNRESARMEILPKIPEKALYGVPAIFIASLFGYFIYDQGGSVPWATILPFLVVGCAFTGNRLFAYAIPPVLLAQVSTSQFFSFPGFMYSVAGVACLLVFALTYRVLTVAHSAFPPGTIRTRLTDVPEKNARHKRARSFHWGEAVSLLLVPVVAWLLSGKLVDHVSRFDETESRLELGLLPETYFILRLAVALAGLVLILRSGLAYGRSLFAPLKLSGIELRREIWRWNGREQSIVGKQVRKAKAWNKSYAHNERNSDV